MNIFNDFYFWILLASVMPSSILSFLLLEENKKSAAISSLVMTFSSLLSLSMYIFDKIVLAKEMLLTLYFLAGIYLMFIILFNRK